MPLRHFKHDLEQNEDYHLHIFSLQSALVVKVEWEWYCFYTTYFSTAFIRLKFGKLDSQ